MSVSSAEVRGIVERVCARPEVLDPCARRDLGTVISALGAAGLTQGRIAELTGFSQGRLSEWATGKRTPKAVTTFQRFANGVGLPPAARRALGLDAGSQAAIVTAAPADVSVSYPDTSEQAARNASRLWIADLDDATLIQRGRVQRIRETYVAILVPPLRPGIGAPCLFAGQPRVKDHGRVRGRPRRAAGY
jgi:transcriptional regulator with XRE-family HTH domain